MLISNTSIRQPVFTTMVIAALVVFGVIAYRGLGIDLFPKVDFPIITISAVLPGADPETIESDVTERIEEAVNTINGVKSLRSQSSDSVSIVVVEFELDRNVDVAAQDVRDKISATRVRPADGPRGAGHPEARSGLHADPRRGVVLQPAHPRGLGLRRQRREGAAGADPGRRLGRDPRRARPRNPHLAPGGPPVGLQARGGRGRDGDPVREPRDPGRPDRDRTAGADGAHAGQDPAPRGLQRNRRRPAADRPDLPARRRAASRTGWRTNAASRG